MDFIHDRMDNETNAEKKSTKIRILLVDDQPTVLKGLELLFALESDLQIVAEANDGLTAIRLSKEFRPDVVVMDVEMPGIDGIETTKAIRQLDPDTKVIILSIHADPAIQARAQKAGAIAYVEKQGDAARLIKEIRKACENR